MEEMIERLVACGIPKITALCIFQCYSERPEALEQYIEAVEGYVDKLQSKPCA